MEGDSFFQQGEEETYREFRENLRRRDPDSIIRAYYEYYSVIRNSHSLGIPYNEEKWREVEKKYQDWRNGKN